MNGCQSGERLCPCDECVAIRARLREIQMPRGTFTGISWSTRPWDGPVKFPGMRSTDEGRRWGRSARVPGGRVRRAG